MIAKDARCTREIKYRIVMVNVSLNRKKTSFHLQIGFKI